MPKKPSVGDLDRSFRMLFVVLTLIDGFLLAYAGGGESGLILTFYFGLNFLPIIILGLIWWAAIFFDRTVWKLFAWFMLFNLIVQSFLLVLSTFFPIDWLFLVFPFTPIIVVPIEIAIYRRYIGIGQSIKAKQTNRAFWLCTAYSVVQFFWFMILFLWLVAMIIIQLFKTF